MIIILLIYSYILDIYTPSMFVSYLIFLTIGSFNVQAMGQTIGIINSNSQRMAVFVSIGFFLTLFVFSNYVIKAKELHYILQTICKINPVKLVMECIMIAMYGFDRCADREFSLPLYIFDIDDNDYYENFRILIVQFVIFRFVPMLALLLKVNSVNSSKELEQKRSQAIEKFLKQKSTFNAI